MTAQTWKCISASVRGTSHLSTGIECQDFHLHKEIESDDGPVLLAVVSDGAGSAKRSSVGAQLLCEVISEQAELFFADHGRISTVGDRLIASWVEQFRSEVILRATNEGLSEREFACTMLGAFVGESEASFFQIGDGAITYSVSRGGGYTLAFWPERGEFENTTYFATQPDFLNQLLFASVRSSIAQLAILSDGLQRLALNYETRGPFEPFFSGFFPHLESAERGSVPRLNEELAKYLDSTRVNARTDDDKTLLLAVRAEAFSECQHT